MDAAGENKSSLFGWDAYPNEDGSILVTLHTD
jgi:hypothetical protein